MTFLTDTSNDTIVRDATPDDAEFLAWTMLSAGRSHLARGVWDHLLGRGESAVLDYLAELSRRGPEHLFHWSRFVVAEVDGQVAAALSAHDPSVHGFATYLPIATQLFLDTGGTDVDALMSRGEDLLSAMTPPPPSGAWVVESVATAPQFRRRGLVDRLLGEILDRGRRGRHSLAHISVFIGNEPARAAYVRHGFRHLTETRTAAWETAIGCPGVEQLVLDYD